MRAMIILYGIPNCDTVKRARAWLDEQGLEYRFHDFKKLGLPAERWAPWVAAVGWERLVNRQGTMWRKLDPAQQAGVVDAASACALAVLVPSVVKRPVVEWADGRISVGFSASDWAAALP